MKKIITFSIASIFLLLFSLGLSSALISNINVNSVSGLNQEDGSFNLTIKNNNMAENETINLTINDIVAGDGKKIEFSIDGIPETKILLVENNSNITVNVIYAIESNFDFKIGAVYSTNILINNTDKGDISFEETNYCGSVESVGDLKLEIEDVNVISGFGEDDDFWYLRDEIEIEVKVTNDGNWDMSDIALEWILYTSDNTKISEDKVDEFNLDSDEDTTLTFTIKLDEDMDEFDREDAILYVRAMGKIDDRDSSYNGDDTCATEEITSEVITDDNFVILDNFIINDIESYEGLVEGSFPCGSQVTVIGEAWNIGEDDEDEVSLEVYSEELEIYEKIELGNIDSYDSSEFSFTFDIPKNLEEKVYKVSFEVYDEDGNLFENGENDESIFYKYFSVAGNCKIISPGVTAQLESGAIAGEEMIIKSLITNNENKSVMYTVFVENYETFGKLQGITPEVILLNGGEIKEVEFKFLLNKDAIGENSFNIVVNRGNETVEVQPVLVTIEKPVSPTPEVISKIFKNENVQLIGIILLNVILITAIVIVTKKILKRK